MRFQAEAKQPREAQMLREARANPKRSFLARSPVKGRRGINGTGRSKDVPMGCRLKDASRAKRPGSWSWEAVAWPKSPQQVRGTSLLGGQAKEQKATKGATGQQYIRPKLGVSLLAQQWARSKGQLGPCLCVMPKQPHLVFDSSVSCFQKASSPSYLGNATDMPRLCQKRF